MQTNADKALECRQNADKKGENMKKTEKWKPHPTRANIFINQSNGLLNESSIYFARIFYSFGD